MFANILFLLTEHLCHYGTALVVTFIGSGTTIWACRSVRRNLMSKFDRHDLNFDRLNSDLREHCPILGEVHTRGEVSHITSAILADTYPPKGAISGKKD